MMDSFVKTDVPVLVSAHAIKRKEPSRVESLTRRLVFPPQDMSMDRVNIRTAHFAGRRLREHSGLLTCTSVFNVNSLHILLLCEWGENKIVTAFTVQSSGFRVRR